jgi:hypothetical protein
MQGAPASRLSSATSVTEMRRAAGVRDEICSTTEPEAVTFSSRPSSRRAIMAFGQSESPAPTSRILATCSTTSVSTPTLRSATAAASPPIPPPRITARIGPVYRTAGAVFCYSVGLRGQRRRLDGRFHSRYRGTRTSAVRAAPPTSGLYLHSPALEGLWMEAHQEHTGKGVQVRSKIHRASTQPFPRPNLSRQGEKP